MFCLVCRTTLVIADRQTVSLRNRSPQIQCLIGVKKLVRISHGHSMFPPSSSVWTLDLVIPKQTCTGLKSPNRFTPSTVREGSWQFGIGNTHFYLLIVITWGPNNHGSFNFSFYSVLCGLVVTHFFEPSLVLSILCPP